MGTESLWNPVVCVILAYLSMELMGTSRELVSTHERFINRTQVHPLPY